MWLWLFLPWLLINRWTWHVHACIPQVTPCLAFNKNIITTRRSCISTTFSQHHASHLTLCPSYQRVLQSAGRQDERGGAPSGWHAVDVRTVSTTHWSFFLVVQCLSGDVCGRIVTSQTVQLLSASYVLSLSRRLNSKLLINFKFLATHYQRFLFIKTHR